jgi:hypothetical protein
MLQPYTLSPDLSSQGTGTWARSTFREHRSDSWNRNMMEHRSEYRWNVIHTTGTPMEREAQNSSDERKQKRGETT